MNPDEQLAAFCATLPQLREAARRQGLARELADVLAEIRTGTPVADLLPRLGIPSDALRSGSGYQPIPGVSPRPADEVYVCPQGACDRAVGREPGGPVPDERCWILDEPLRRGRA